jgi:hypothetical protein
LASLSVAVLGGEALLAKVPWDISVLCNCWSALDFAGIRLVGVLTQHVLDLAAHGQDDKNQPVDDQNRPEDRQVENLAP